MSLPDLVQPVLSGRRKLEPDEVEVLVDDLYHRAWNVVSLCRVLCTSDGVSSEVAFIADHLETDASSLMQALGKGR